MDVSDENLDSFNVFSDLFVDAESLFEESVFLLFGNISELKAIIVVESVDVVHNTSSLRSNGSKDEQVLEIAVLSEIRVVQNNALEKFNELIGKLGINESAHCHCNLVNIFGFGKSSLHNLVNNLLSVRVLFNEYLSPKLGRLTFYEVTSLHSE